MTSAGDVDESPVSGVGRPPHTDLPEPTEFAPIYNAVHRMFAARSGQESRAPGSTDRDVRPWTGDDEPARATMSRPPGTSAGDDARAGGLIFAGLREATAALRIAQSATARAAVSRTAASTPPTDRNDVLIDATHDLFDALSTLLQCELSAADPTPDGNVLELATMVEEIRQLTIRSEVSARDHGHRSPEG